MKTVSFLTFLIALGILANCSQEKKLDDPEIIKKVLSDYFDGLKTRDINKLNAVTTDDFKLFEDGKVWNNDSLINALNSFKSFDGSWTFDNMNVNMDELSGSITYFNHGSFVINDTIKRKPEWIESATFKKIDGTWKMNFLHSSVRK